MWKTIMSRVFTEKCEKNAMLDLPVILFIIYGLEECIRSAVMM